MPDVNMNIIGFPEANPGLTAYLRNPSTNEIIASAQPLADGSVTFRNIPPGSYFASTTYANLVGNITFQTVQVMAQGETRVVMMIDPSKFKNVPLADLVDVNLSPFVAESQSIRVAAASVATKKGGEIFTANDFNKVAGAVRDLANVVGSLAQSVTPIGHNHPEYENKLTELSTNFQALLQTLTESTVQMQRRFEIMKLRDRVEDLLGVTTLADPSAARKTVFEQLTAMESNIPLSPQLYAQAMRTAAGKINVAMGPVIANVPAASAQIVANYTAVINLWLVRKGRSLQGEVFSHVETAANTQA